MSPVRKTLPEALTTARRSVVRFDNAATRAGVCAKEETLTDLLLTRMGRHADVGVFSRHQESRHTGADWIWWFHECGDWAGVLVQAKRLGKLVNGVARYGFDYQPKSRDRTQREILLSAAKQLQVPAAYVLYNGKRLPAGATGSCEAELREPLRERMGVAIVPALLVDLVRKADLDIVPQSMPLECLVCSRELFRSSPWSAPLATAELVEYLQSDRSTLPTRVAGSLVDSLIAGHAAHPQPEPPDGIDGFGLDVPIDPRRLSRVFQGMSRGVALYSEPYLQHVRRGLRTQAPDYVGALQQGAERDEIWSNIPENVAGVVVISVSLPDDG